LDEIYVENLSDLDRDGQRAGIYCSDDSFGADVKEKEM